MGWKNPNSSLFNYVIVFNSFTPRHQTYLLFTHDATRRKVAGSIPGGVIGIFHWHNSSGYTMTLRTTQPLIGTSTRIISWGIMQPMRSDDNLSTFISWLFWYVGASNSWKPQDQFRPVQELLYLYHLIIYTYSTSSIWFSIKRTHLLCKSSQPLFLKRNNSAFHRGR